MNTIWKFPLSLNNPIGLKMPLGAEVLTVQAQFDEPMMWALVDTEKETEFRFFEIFGTGHIVPTVYGETKRKYINTFQVNEGNYVFHLFELLTKFEVSFTEPTEVNK